MFLQFALVLVAMALPLPASVAEGSPASVHYQAGLAHKEAGDLDEAAAELQAAIAADPTHANAWWVLGWVCAASERTDDAVDAFERFIDLHPGTRRAREVHNAIARLTGAPRFWPPERGVADFTEYRGLAVHPADVLSPDACRRTVDRLVAGHFNIATVAVWERYAYWQTDSWPVHPRMKDGFDPLGYFIELCHARGIEVHAWLVIGAADMLTVPEDLNDSFLVQSLPDSPSGWWDLVKPEVREYLSAYPLEVAERYDVDGVCLDYIRYGPPCCFCDHCVAAIQELYGHDVRALIGEAFPLTTTVAGNALTTPDTARVLVQQEDGPPLVALNELGEGRVLLFNYYVWNYHPPGAITTLLRRFVDEAGAQNHQEGELLAFRPQASIDDAYSRGISIGPDLVTGATGRPVRRIADVDLDSLSAGDVLFLIDAWVTPTGVTEKLIEFVERGGQIVIFDAPRKCISDPAMQRLTGFGDGATFHRTEHAVLDPVGDSSLVPTCGTALAAEEIEQIDADWLAYRTRGVTDLVRLVNQKVKSERPKLPLSAYVWADADIARDNYAQDWAGWLQTGIVDFVQPMAYTTDDGVLQRNLEQYAEIDPVMVRIIPALSLYQRSEGKQAPRSPEMVLGQIDLAREAGARGVALFANGHLSDEVLAALTEGPFREPARPYLPGMSTAE